MKNELSNELCTLKKIIIEKSNGTEIVTKNIGYSSKKNSEKLLSNLFPYKFNFEIYEVKSVESVLQSLKSKDIIIQNACFDYYGFNAYALRDIMDDWTIDGKLYWQGNTIDRNSIEYQKLLDRIYISVFSNPLFRESLLKTKGYYLYHNGNNDPKQTVLTPTEYLTRLHILRYALINGESMFEMKKNLTENRKSLVIKV